MFLKNAWYVAAQSHVVGDALLPLTLLGENLVLFRDSNGAAAALVVVRGSGRTRSPTRLISMVSPGIGLRRKWLMGFMRRNPK